jgi:hypothetical protein
MDDNYLLEREGVGRASKHGTFFNPPETEEILGMLERQTDAYPVRELEEEFSFSTFPKAVLDLLRRGLEAVAVSLAVRFGIHNENRLSDLIFFRRHPERSGRLLRKGEKNFKTLSQEWVHIRDQLVRPPIARAFFTEYELRFNPGASTFGVPANAKMSSLEKRRRIEDVEAILPELKDRTDRRAAEALRHRQLPPERVKSHLVLLVRRLSAAQLELFREFFPDNSGGISFNAFQFSFELFANGELRNPAKGGGFGEPDGEFYFLFAEFAFLCIDSGIEGTAWTKALKAFVKTQEIFMHIYRPGPHGKPPKVGARLPKPTPTCRRLNAYDNRNFNVVGQSDRARKERLREKYDRMNLHALRMAASQNMLQAMCMP